MGKSLAATAIKPSVSDLSGMDRIDPDVPLRELQYCGLGQSAQPPFARSVGGVVMRRQSCGRGNVDYRATTAVADRRRAMLHSQHCTGEIDRQGPVPRLDGRIDDALTRDRPGVVDENVQLAELRQCGCYGRLPRRLIGNILAQEKRLAALAAEPLCQALAGSGIDIGSPRLRLLRAERARL